LTKRELQNQLKLLEHQLTLAIKYSEHFKKVLGKNGVENFIDRILDKIILNKRLLKELENNSNDE
jgi:hypothetical protein